MKPDESFLDALRTLVGAAQVLTDPAAQSPYLREPRDKWHGTTSAVVRPANTDEVAAVMRLAATHKVPLIPQGGNTGLVGGQVPLSGEEIILSLQRLDKIRALDPATNSLTVEAGVSLQRVQEFAAHHDRLFPLSMASEGTCTIGGNLATNAGGTGVLAYGTTRDLVLGIEAVLADGSVLSDLQCLRKNNTGYDLKNLLIGSEGTLAIITAAVLKLFPLPRARTTAWCALPNVRVAVDLLQRMQQEAYGVLTAFELVPRRALDLLLLYADGARDPLAIAAPWYVLLETSANQREHLETSLGVTLDRALEHGLITDAAVAQNEQQSQEFWRLRESISWVQSQAGGSIKHDIALPIAAVPDFLAETDAAVLRLVPGARPLPFGHLGDGNLHYNILQPLGADKATFLARWDDVSQLVHGLVHRYKGSISAEHGIGQLKREALEAAKDPVALATMRQLKRALDPDDLLNKGKVFRGHENPERF